MSRYSPHWLTIFLAAIILHLAAGMTFAFVLPKIWPEKIFESEELSWLDVELAAESPVVEVEETVPLDEEPAPEPEFQPFVMPELVIPETIFEPLPELPPPPPPYVPKPVEKPPAPVESPAPVPAEPKPAPTPPSEPEEEEPQQMGEPPKTLKEVQPTESLGYAGFVTVRVRIGTDGGILYADVMRSSKRDEVDALAMDCAKKWEFEPALDQKGRPMACDKIITFDFRKID